MGLLVRYRWAIAVLLMGFAVANLIFEFIDGASKYADAAALFFPNLLWLLEVARHKLPKLYLLTERLKMRWNNPDVRLSLHVQVSFADNDDFDWEHVEREMKGTITDSLGDSISERRSTELGRTEYETATMGKLTLTRYSATSEHPARLTADFTNMPVRYKSAMKVLHDHVLPIANKLPRLNFALGNSFGYEVVFHEAPEHPYIRYFASLWLPILGDGFEMKLHASGPDDSLLISSKKLQVKGTKQEHLEQSITCLLHAAVRN